MISRSIRPQPILEILENGSILHRDPDGTVHVNTDEDMAILDHWNVESVRCEDELELWLKFLKWKEQDQFYFKQSFNLDLETTDPQLLEILTKLRDWQLFQLLRWKSVYGSLISKDRARLKPSSCGEDWNDKLYFRQRRLEQNEKILRWVTNEYPKLLADCLESIRELPSLERSLEEKIKTQTYAMHDEIKRLGGTPNRPVYPADQSIDLYGRLCHWNSQTEYFQNELHDWRIFLTRQWEKERSDVASISAFATSKSRMVINSDAVDYRKSELEKARRWVDCWQEYLAEEEIKDQESYEIPEGVVYGGGSITGYVRANIDLAHQDVAKAMERLEWAQQVLARISAENETSNDNDATMENIEHQLPITPPQTSSGSPESRSRDRRKGAPTKPPLPSRRSQRLRNKSSNEVLGPIHSTKVLKPAPKKTAKTKQKHRSDKTDHLESLFTKAANTEPTTVLPEPSTKKHKGIAERLGALRHSARNAKRTDSSIFLGASHATKVTKSNIKKKLKTKKPKTFTDQQQADLLNSASSPHQNMASLNVTSTAPEPTPTTSSNPPPINTVPLRRSERLKQQAASQVSDAPPTQLRSVQASRTSKPKQNRSKKQPRREVRPV